MKPTAHFKMPQQVKRIMATIVDKDLRDSFRQISIQATLCSLVKPEKPAKTK